MLIVGYGSIGAAVEDRLTAVRVHAWTGSPAAPGSRRAARCTPSTNCPACCRGADVVVLTTPLTEQTRGLANAPFLAAMKDGALLVNVARGPVVDTKALLAEAESGRLTAALDVTDPEPLPSGHPLWHAPGVLISPHVGGSTSAFLPRARGLVPRSCNASPRGSSWPTWWRPADIGRAAPTAAERARPRPTAANPLMVTHSRKALSLSDNSGVSSQYGGPL